MQQPHKPRIRGNICLQNRLTQQCTILLMIKWATGLYAPIRVYSTLLLAIQVLKRSWNLIAISSLNFNN